MPIGLVGLLPEVLEAGSLGGFNLPLQMLSGSPGAYLKGLQDGFMQAAMQGAGGPLGLMGMPPMMMPSPMSVFPSMMGLAGGGYAAPLLQQGLGLAALSNPFAAALMSNPVMQAAFQSAVGGALVGAGPASLMVQGFAPGFGPMPGMGLNPMAGLAFGALSGLRAAVNPLGMMGGGLVGNFMMGGLAGLLGGGMPPPGLFNFGGLAGPLGSGGFGSWNPNAQPGLINNTNPAYEAASSAQVSGVLADPCLSVEDKIMLMIMLIMKKMDADIERQAQYVNQLQNQQGGQQGKGGGKGAMGIGGGKGKGGGQNSQSSVDIESQKMKRMVDKREQMFDMLKAIIDRYNQTAKGVIDRIGQV